MITTRHACDDLSFDHLRSAGVVVAERPVADFPFPVDGSGENIECDQMRVVCGEEEPVAG